MDLIGKPWRKVHSELSLKLDRRGDDGLAYANDRTYMGRRSDYPIEGLYVHPLTDLVRDQSHAIIRKRYRKP